MTTTRSQMVDNVLVGLGLAACILFFTACSSNPVDEGIPSYVAEDTASEGDTIAPPDRPEDLLADARVVASAMDPLFADDSVWEATQTTAQYMCQLVAADPAGAGQTIIELSIEYGVTAEQAGIIWGVASNVYCPELIDVAVFG